MLTGPALHRLKALLNQLRRGYQEKEETVASPRGRILWGGYVAESLTRGHWEQLPYRFPDLDHDPVLRRQIRWALERLHADLSLVGQSDVLAATLAGLARQLLVTLTGVPPSVPAGPTWSVGLASAWPTTPCSGG